MTSPATEFRVNTGVLFSQTMPVSTTLADGTVVVAWTDRDAQANTRLLFQHFDAQGNPLGAVGVVADQVALYEPAAIASLKGGGFAISWQTYDGDIHAERYSPNLTAQGEVQVNAPATPVQQQNNQAITGLNDGGYLVTWRSEIDLSTGYQGVFMQRYDANGAPVGGQTIVESMDHVALGNSVATSLVSGGWLVAWQHDNEVEMRRYDAGGQPAGNGAPQVVVAPDANNTLGYGLEGVGALNDGGWIVMYGDSHSGLLAQRYDATGTAVGAAALVAQNVMSQYAELPTFTSLKDGGYVITWEARVGTQGDIHAQLFAANGDRVGGEFTVNSYTDLAQTSPTVTALPDGGFLIAWDSGEDGSATGIYAKRFDANGVAQSNEGWLDGTAGNDTIQYSGSANARLSGFDGNDTLTGGAGNDTIDGGAGNDVLVASSGQDTYTGGTGVDTAAFNFATSAITAVSQGAYGSGTVWTANGATGLAEIERAQFTDGLFAIDTQAPVGFSVPGGDTWWAAADFHLAFGVIPGIEELSRWTARADQLGGDPAKLAQDMINTYAPGVSNHDLVAFVLQQVTHSTPTEDQVQNYERLMAPNPQPTGGSAPYFPTQGDFVEYMLALNSDPIVGFTGSTPQLDPGWFA